MAQIDDRELIGSRRFLLKVGSQASESFETTHAENERVRLNLVFVFEDDADEKAAPSIQVKGRVKDALIVFQNWRTALGVATAEPVLLATEKNTQLLLEAAGWQIGAMRVLDVQITKRKGSA